MPAHDVSLSDVNDPSPRTDDRNRSVLRLKRRFLAKVVSDSFLDHGYGVKTHLIKLDILSQYSLGQLFVTNFSFLHHVYVHVCAV